MPNTNVSTVETDFAKATTTLTDKQMVPPINAPTGRLAIGPRVTFHFIDGEWSSSNTYETYDVVQNEGISYVAVQPVPTGIQLTNTNYWFLWSEPNAQWQELIETVQGFQAQINGKAPIMHASDTTEYGAGSSLNYGHVKLTDALGDSPSDASGGTATTPKAVNAAITGMAAPIDHASAEATYGVGNTSEYGHVKLVDTMDTEPGGVSAGGAATPKMVSDSMEAKTHIVCIGDSFTSDKVRSFSWPTQLPERYTVHNYASGGSGFITHGSQSGTGETNHTFVEQIADAVADDSYNHALVKAVIIYGGYNDFRANTDTSKPDNQSDVRAAMGIACKNAETAFPGANVICVVGNQGFGSRTEQSYYRYWVNQLFRSTSQSTRFRTVNAMYWLYGFGATTVFGDDELHPSQQGAAIIARYMSALIDGCYDPAGVKYVATVQGGDTEQDVLYACWNPLGEFSLSGHYTFDVTTAGDNVSMVMEAYGDGRFSQFPDQTCIPLNGHPNGSNMAGTYFNPSNGRLHLQTDTTTASGSVFW